MSKHSKKEATTTPQAEKNHKLIFSKLAKINEALTKFKDLDHTLKVITNTSKEVSGAKYVALYLKVGDKVILKAHTANLRLINKVSKITGIKITGREEHLKDAEVWARKFRNPAIREYSDFHELTSGDVPKAVSKTIQKLSGVKKILEIPIKHERKAIGIMHFTYTNEQLDTTIPKLFASQCAQAIRIAQDIEKQRKLQEKYKNLAKENKALFKQIADYAQILEKEVDRKTKDVKGREKQLKDIVEGLPAPVFIKDAQGRYIAGNRHWEEVTGHSRKKALGKNDYDFRTKKEADRITKDDHRILSQKTPSETEIVKTLKGKPYTYLTYKFPLLDSKGKMYAIFGIASDITERKEMEEALEKSEKQLHDILDTSPTPVFVKDLQGKYVLVNRQWEERWGIPKEKAIGKTDYELSRPKKLADKYARDDKKVIAAKTHLEFEEEMPQKDGLHTYITHKFPLLDAKGTPYAVCGIATDITERKRSAEVLREERDKAQKYLDVAGVIILVLNAKQEVTLINRKGCKILGYKTDEVIGKNWFDNFIPKGRRKPARDRFKKLMRGNVKVAEYGENSILTKDKKESLIAWHNTVLKDGKGNITATLSSGEDITEQKKAEEELRIKDSAIKSSINAIAISNLEGNLTYVNKAFLKMWGYKNDKEVLGKNAVTFWKNREDPKEAIKGLQKHGSWRGELVALKKNRSTFIAHLTASLVTDEKGKPTCMMGSFIDITDRKKAEEALQESEEQYRGLFQDSPTPLWEEDLSSVKKYVDKLKQKGVKDLKAYFQKNPQTLIKYASQVKLVNVNKAALKLYKAKNKEAFNRNLASISTEDTYKVFSEGLIAMLEEKKSFQAETTTQTLNGEIKHIFFKLSVPPGQGKTLSRVLVSVIDITQRKKAEEALRQSEEKFRELAEQSPNMIFINKKGRVIYANKRCEEIMGYKREKYYSPDFDFLTLIAPEHRSSVQKAFNTHMKGKNVLPFEYTLITRDNKRIDVLFTSKVIKYGKEEAILGIMTDITDRKRAEQELENKVEQLSSLNKTSQALTASLKLDQVLAKIVSLASRVVKSDSAWVALVNKRGELGQHAESMRGLTIMQHPIRPKGITNWIIESRQAVVINNINNESAISPSLPKGAPHTANQHIVKAKIKSLIGLPLIAKDRLLGVLYLQSLRPNNFCGTLPLLTTFANHAAIAIENAQLHEAALEELEERKQAENALRESEERYRTLFEESPVSLSEQDLSGVKKYLDKLKKSGIENFKKYFEENPKEVEKCATLVKMVSTNQANLRLYGAKNIEQFCNGLKSVFTKSSYESFKKELVAIAKGNLKFGNESVTKTLDGKERLILLRWTVAPGYEKTLSKVLVSTVDITERKEAEEALRESEERFRMLAEQSLMGITILQDDKIKYVNKATANILKYSTKTILNWQPTEFLKVIHPEDRPFVADQASKKQRGVDKNIVTHYPFRITTKSKRTKWVELYSKSVIYQGMPADFITLIDITERKVLEEMWKRYEFIANTSRDLMILFDKKYTYKAVNEAYCRAHGKTREEIIGKSVFDIWTDPKHNKTTRRSLDKCFRGNEVQYQHWFKFPALERRYYDVIYYPYKNREGKVTHAVVVSRDITDQQKGKEALIKAKKETEKGYRAQAQFLADVAHSLKTPLATAIGYIGIAKKNIDDKQELKESYKMIRSEIQDMSKQVSELLSLSRITLSKRKLSKTKFNLNNLLEKTCKSVELLSKEIHAGLNKKRVIKVKTLGPLNIRADRTKIQQVLLNILDNAVRHSPQRGELPQIMATLEKDNNYAKITIKDHGKGIPKTRLLKLFERSYHIGPGQGGHLGIGLALCKEIVELHQGKIKVESKLGKGTKFTIYLPLDKLSKKLKQKERYKLVFFDIDGTLIDSPPVVWQYLRDYFNIKTSKETIKEGISGKLPYDEWIKYDVDQFIKAGLTETRLAEAVRKLKPMQGAAETLNKLRSQGIKVAIISGSIDLLLTTHLPHVKFDYLHTNRIFFDKKGNITSYEPAYYERKDKTEQIEKILEAENLSLDQCVFICDDTKDLDAMASCGLGIAFNPKSKSVEQAANVVIKKKDLRLILPYILGGKKG